MCSLCLRMRACHVVSIIYSQRIEAPWVVAFAARGAGNLRTGETSVLPDGALLQDMPLPRSRLEGYHWLERDPSGEGLDVKFPGGND
jgi:hypothetical protein